MKQFSPFRFDVANQCLWRQLKDAEEQRISLTPKSFAILRHLVEHAPRLITHRELLDAVWPKAAVLPEVLSSHIRDLRDVLGDDPRKPTFIETVARRGYRFIASVTEGSTDASEHDATALVGRSTTLVELDDYLRAALSGKRQIVFITGEPGIGKTALADEFRRRATGRLQSLRVVRGQCIEGYGGHEAYFPVLKAVAELSRGPAAGLVVKTLAEQAPTWLIQFPTLFEQHRRDFQQLDIVGATSARMLREISEALETITSTSALLMILEDLQWVDLSTLDFISEIARRRQHAKLMLVMTYRPLDVALAKHPLQHLKQDLLVRQLCREISLGPLSESDIADYLGATASSTDSSRRLAAVLSQRSEGNPLFMVAALDEMRERGVVSRRETGWKPLVRLEDIDPQVPENLRQMIESQIERLGAREERALEVAAVAGATFASRICAAAAGFEPREFEEICEPLARRNHLIRAVGRRELPGGDSSPAYGFVHVLYREVFSRRQTPGLRSARHRQIAETLETLYGSDAGPVASELAEHFEQGLDWTRAVRYLHVAAQTAEHRFAHREAEALLRRALELVKQVPEAERPTVEVDTLDRLGRTYVASFDVRCIETYEAMAKRAAQYGMPEVEIRALVDLCYCLSWISADQALKVLSKAFTLTDQLPESPLRASMRIACLVGRVWVGGWNTEDAHEARRALETIRSTQERSLLAPHLIAYSQIQWIFSEYREALDYAVEGLAILMESSGPNPYINIPYQRGQTVLLRSLLLLGQWGRALSEIDAAITLADKNGDYLPAQSLRLNRAWVQLEAADFAGALEICDQLSRASTHFASGYVRRLSMILGGAAEAGLGRHERALEKLSAAKRGIESQSILGDWYFRMLLESALVDLALSKGDLSAARQASDRFIDAALETEERTWTGLAWESAARVAEAEGDRELALKCIEKALFTIEGRELPLAAWRVHATAGLLSPTSGQDNRGRRYHLERSQRVILELAASLPHEAPLREIFLCSARVTRIRREGATS